MNKNSVDKKNLDNQNKIVNHKGLTEDQSNTLTMNTDQNNNIEKRLSETQKYLKIFIDRIPETIFLMDINGKIIVSNTTFSKRLGLSSDSTEGLCVYDLLDKETADRRREYIKTVVSSKKPLKIEDVRGNRIIDNNLYPILDDKNEVTHIAVIGFDITEQKKTQQMLKESEEKYRSLFESVEAGVLIQSANGNIIEANETASKILGLPKSNILEKTSLDPQWNMILEDGTPVAGEDHPSMITIRTGMSLKNQIRGLYANDPKKIRWLKINTKPIYNEDNTLKEVLITFDDITNLKKYQDELIQSEQKYRELYENMGTCVAIYDAVDNGEDFVFKSINKAGENKSMVKAEEIKGKSVQEIFPGVKDMGLFDVFKRVYATGKPEYHPTTLYKDDRLSQWVQNYVYKLPSGEIVAIYEDVSERKKAEEALKESEERFRLFFEKANDSIILFNYKDEIVESNEAASKFFGYSKEEFLSLKVTDLQAPEVRGISGNVIKSELENFKEKIFESVDVNKNGERLPVEVSTSKIKYKGEDLALGIIRDIRERKKMEKQLEDSEHHYRSIFENSPIAMWEEDYSLVKKEIDKLKKSGISNIKEYLEENMDIVRKCVPLVKIIDFNNSVLTLYNAKNKEDYLNNLANVFSENSFNMFKNAMVCIAEGKTFLSGEDKNYTLDGKEIDVFVTWTVVPGYENDYSKVYVSDLDITPIKKAQQIIKDSEEKLRNLVNTANEGIWSMDENFLTTFVNPKMSEMLGYTPEEMIGKRVEYFMFEEDLEDHSDKMKSRKIGLSQKYERRFKKKNGEELFTIVSATPLMDNKGNFKGSFAMFTDITERKKNEETIKQLNDNLKLLNKILRHDISNDLTVISIALEMIKTENIEFKNKAFNAIQRSVNLIDKIRSLESTMDFRNKLKTISIKQVINSLKKTYPNITIKINKDCKIMADEAFTSVLDNIINNAIVHGKSDKIDIEIDPKKDICEIKIIDYGKGIPDEIKEKIFEEGFSYGKTGGTGLGLYIVKKTIERYGGSIEVQDTKPHGATFIVKLKKCIC